VESSARAPEWAQGFAAPIPFVGRDHASAKPPVLVDGSAEDFNTRDDRCFGDLPTSRRRHRASRVLDRTHDEPVVGIAPFDDRGLCLAAALLIRWTGGAVPTDRSALVESVAVANVSKFGRPNDGRQDRDVEFSHIRGSLPFLQGLGLADTWRGRGLAGWFTLLRRRFLEASDGAR
jgi:hypothetical protein